MESSNTKNGKKKHAPAIESAAARGRFFTAAYLEDFPTTIEAATPEEARMMYASRLPIFHDEAAAHGYIVSSMSVRFLYWLEKQAAMETKDAAQRGQEKTDTMNDVISSVMGKKGKRGKKNTLDAVRATLASPHLNGGEGAEGEAYVYHIADEARTAQMISAYTRHGNDDGGDLFDTVFDTVARFVTMYENIYIMDTGRPITDLLQVEPARGMDGKKLSGIFSPAPVFFPFHLLTEKNPEWKPEKPETRENPRTRTLYRAIFRDMEKAHRQIFFTSATTSLDTPLDAEGEITVGDTIPDTPSETPEEKVDAGTATRAAWKVCAILGKSDSELASMLKKLTVRDEYGHWIAADPAVWENFTRRARVVLDSPTPELARLLHSLDITATNHTMQNAYAVISLLRREAREIGDAIVYARLSSVAERIQKKREEERKNAGDAEALREALLLLKNSPQAPTPPTILMKLSPAQKRSLAAARRQNQRSHTEFFSGDYRRGALLDALKKATQKADHTLGALLDALPLQEERPQGKAVEVYDARAVLIPGEYRPSFYIPLSPRQVQIFRRMKRNEENTADRLSSLSPVAPDHAAITAAVITSERRRYGEEPDAEVTEALILFAVQHIYSLRYGRSYGGLIWEPTEKELLTALRHATMAAEVIPTSC